MLKETAPKKVSFFEKNEEHLKMNVSLKEEEKVEKETEEKTSAESVPKGKKFQRLSAYFPSSALSTKPTKKAQYLLFFIVLLLAIVASIFFFLKYQEAIDAANAINGQAAQSSKEIKKTIEKVGKHIELPKNETPTIVTITDSTKRSNQAFLKNAKIGDKVLIFRSNQMAYLYRPSIDRLVNVAPINVNQNSSLQVTSPTDASVTPSVASAPITAQKISVVLWNGTAKVGLTKTAEINLKAKNNAIEVVDRDNAKSSTYSSSIVIDLSGNQKSQADTIAALVGGKVATLPKDETKPAKGDILVILGSDYK